jgi:ankyrin repeat protein
MTEQLIKAARSGNLNRVKELLNRGAKINAKDNNGYQAIHWATRQRHLPVVKELLNRGANIHARDNRGRNPIYMAASLGHLPVVKELLNRGANIHARDTRGNQPIHRAVQFGHLPIVKELIRHGASIEGVMNQPMNNYEKNAIKKYIENRNVYHALSMFSKAKIGNTNQNLMPLGFPINALVKSLRRK